jgi:hypothetical protein
VGAEVLDEHDGLPGAHRVEERFAAEHAVEIDRQDLVGFDQRHMTRQLEVGAQPAEGPQAFRGRRGRGEAGDRVAGQGPARRREDDPARGDARQEGCHAERAPRPGHARVFTVAG